MNPELVITDASAFGDVGFETISYKGTSWVSVERTEDQQKFNQANLSWSRTKGEETGLQPDGTRTGVSPESQRKRYARYGEFSCQWPFLGPVADRDPDVVKEIKRSLTSDPDGEHLIASARRAYELISHIEQDDVQHGVKIGDERKVLLAVLPIVETLAMSVAQEPFYWNDERKGLGVSG